MIAATLRRVALSLSFSTLLACGAENPLDAYRDYFAQAGMEPGAVTATFLGTATLLFDDGETALMTDGFFSRPAIELALDASGDPLIEPDVATVEAWLERLGVEELAAVIPVHSHFDHAMDTPVVAERTGALVVGSRSTGNIARGWGLPENQIAEVRSGDTYQFGKFSVTLIRSQHAQLGGATPFPGEVTEPLRPPVPVSAYREGASYSILVEHPRGSALVQGSAGWLDNALDDLSADVVFLGIGGLGTMDAEYRGGYWTHVVGAVAPARILAIHWDDFTRPLHEELTPAGILANGFDDAMRDVIARSAAAGIRLELPPTAQPVVLY